MPSYAQQFFLTNTKQTTPALPAQVYDLTATGAVLGAATTLTWSANAQSFRRVNPYDGNTTTTAPPAVGAAASNFGWRLRRADADASEPRFIAAGTWQVNAAITTGTYALLAGNPNYSMTAIIYRVSPTGTFTELARATAAARALAATTAADLTASIALGDIVLAAQETLQVEIYIQSQATVNTLNQVTNNVVTVRTNVSFLNLGAPLRTVATRSTADATGTTSDSTLRVATLVRRSTEPTALVDSTVRVAAVVRRTAEATALVDSTSRTGTSVRRFTEAVAPTTDTTQRIVSAVRRTNEVLAALADTALRSTTSRRTISETTLLIDTTTRKATFPRQTAENTALTDTTTRVYVARRNTTEILAALTDTTLRLISTTRIATDSQIGPTDIPIKLVVYGRTARYQFQPADDPLIDPTKEIAGCVRDEFGNPYLGGALVELLRGDGLIVATQISSTVDGTYSFPRNSYDASRYRVIASIESTPPQQAITERNLQPVLL